MMMVIQANAVAQEAKDSVEKVSLAKRVFRDGLKLISTDPNDTIVGEFSVEKYLVYSGRIIRRIDITHVGFEKSIYDSTKRVAKKVSQFANSVHVDTREKTVRQHLFIEEGKPLNPDMVADNERFLRDQDFILDSRIFVAPVEGTDSVDLTVITRDVFSLGVTAGGSFPSAPQLGIYDANIDGRGQRIEFTALIDKDRSPHFGYALRYRKSSIFGSLINFEVGYTELNTGYGIGNEVEFLLFTRIERPLVSPDARWAGGAEVSRNWSKNVYAKPDSAFASYRYKLFDGWVGYNMGIKKEIGNRGRHFLAFRYFDGYYLDPPDRQEIRDKIKYNSGYGFLSEYTFYRQTYYKTRYIYGFGRTEDVPSGISIGFTGGYLKLLNLERPYGSVKLAHGQASRKGNFYRINFQTSGFVNGGDLEDVVMIAKATYFTRLWQLNRYKLRSVISVAYTQVFNHQIINWLKINDGEIPGFETDSLQADKRFAIQLESAVFTPWSLFGFRMAPFFSVDMVPISSIKIDESVEIFWGISAGLRTRNENLIFGTLEAKITFIPSDEFGISKFVFGFKQNLRVKNSGTFVKAPSLIAYN